MTIEAGAVHLWILCTILESSFMALSVIIAGDVVPPVSLNEGISIYEPLKSFLSEADCSIVNLEAPVLDRVSAPIKKSGPSLFTTESSVKQLSDAGFKVVTLANNHFFDYSQAGVDSTIDACQKFGLKTVGGGKSLNEAQKPLLYSKKDKTIAIINACEHEFSIAEPGHGGSNPLDIIQMQEDIARVRPLADFVIVIAHGGVENYQFPTPRMKRWYRHFVDLGADVVVNHHQHCICGYEVYRGKPIFYGLGNLYFPLRDSMVKYDTWQYGCLVRLSLGERIDYELIPYKQSSEGITIRDLEEFNKEIELLNLPIKDDYLLQQKFDEYLLDKEGELKMSLLPGFMKRGLVSSALKRGWMGKVYSGRSLYSLKNRLACESHHEALSRLFSILTK